MNTFDTIREEIRRENLAKLTDPSVYRRTLGDFSNTGDRIKAALERLWRWFCS